MVGDDEGRVSLELAALEAPEELEQAMVVAGDEDRDPLLGVCAGEPPVQLEPGREPGEILGRIPREVGLDAEKEAVAGRVLLGIDDIGAAISKERRDGGDDPRPVCAGDEEADGRIGAQTASIGATLSR
jgi:hypothetical protein